MTERLRHLPAHPTALVFDFDGTLVDAGDTKRRAYRAALRAVTQPTDAALQDAYRRHGTLNREVQLRAAFRDIVGHPPSERQLEHMLTTYGAVVREASDLVKPFAGIEEFLAARRPTHVLVVSSNAPRGEVEASCAALGLAGFFDAIHGFPTGKEQAIDQVRRTWGLPPSSVIYIGDRREDGEVAARAGVRFCRFGPTEPPDGTHIIRTVADLERSLAGEGVR